MELETPLLRRGISNLQYKARGDEVLAELIVLVFWEQFVVGVLLRGKRV